MNLSLQTPGQTDTDSRSGPVSLRLIQGSLPALDERSAATAGAVLPVPTGPTDSSDLLEPFSAARLWQDLVEGRVTIVGHHVEPTHASLSLRRVAPPHRAAMAVNTAKVLAAVLTGCAQKVEAVDSELCASTVSLRISAALRAIGLDRPAREAPLALAMAAAAHSLGRASPEPDAMVTRMDTDGGFEFRMPRLEAVLRPKLTPTEYEVLCAVVAGAAQKQVGLQRCRSPRTVANQLRSISVKLGVSGRLRYIYTVVSTSATRAGEAKDCSRWSSRPTQI